MKITKQDKNGDYVTYEGCLETLLGELGCSGTIIAFLVICYLLVKCVG